MWTFEELRERILNEICFSTIERLSNETLEATYMAKPSFIKKKQRCAEALEKGGFEPEKIETILHTLRWELLQPAIKSSVRGNLFKQIVKSHITGLKLDKTRFEIGFGMRYNRFPKSEKPSFYILDKKTKKLLVGMTKLDIWDGSFQEKVGAYYLRNSEYNTETSKLVCIICNDYEPTAYNSVFNLLQFGFKKDRLCYINGLSPIINTYFGL